MNYSQKELLLLSNYIYISASLSEGTIKNTIDKYRDINGRFTDRSISGAAVGNSLNNKEIKTIFSEIDKEIKQNPEFGDLSVSKKVNDRDIRAICFTDKSGNNPVVVFRGTGGTQGAWIDNFEGAYEEDTRIQKKAEKFIKNDCNDYNNITVTGHSKGGNLAQYVTIKQPDKIKKCISYDGQGFGEEFIANNASEIKTSSAKITSISGYNDYVNGLLTDVAQNKMYVNNSTSIVDAHSPVTLLTENRFDANGNIISIRNQGIIAAKVDQVTDHLSNDIAHADKFTQKAVSSVAGRAISDTLTSPNANKISENIRGIEQQVANTANTIMSETYEIAKQGQSLTKETAKYLFGSGNDIDMLNQDIQVADITFR